MAGRGVDIKLADGVPDLGGLYVLGTERHESRRIDNQLRGRSGRQGDPGESRFYLSAQDEVIRLFAGERIYKILDSRFGPPDGEPIEAKMLTSRIEGAQKKVEEFHFVNRKNVVKYDDVMNEQRKQVYATRRDILEGGDLRDIIIEGSDEQAGWIEQVIEAAVDAHTTGAEFAEDWDWEGMWVALHSIYPMRIGLDEIDREKITREELLDRIFDDAAGYYEEREQEWGPELARSVERFITLQVLDARWREHLDNVDYLRQGIGLRGYAQKDPLVEYKLEAETMFGEMDMLVKQEVVRFLMHAEVQVEETPQLEHEQRQQSFDYLHADAATLEAIAAGQGGDIDEPEPNGFPVVEQRTVDPDRAVGRNDPCWCGSGKKFKRCHGA
jgi:preprotein translocase subunit SecA